MRFVTSKNIDVIIRLVVDLKGYFWIGVELVEAYFELNIVN